MDAARFDMIIRALSASPSRRGIVRALPGFSMAGLLHPLFGTANAKARKHRKKKGKLKRNTFGCVNVGGKCRGKNANCCSGICQGMKPKKGKKDKSTCLAHNVLDCPAGADGCAGQLVECGTGGIWGECFQTTGQASFCAMGGGACVVCQKDTDCEALGFGPGAACTVCPELCADTGGTFCLPAAV